MGGGGLAEDKAEGADGGQARKGFAGLLSLTCEQWKTTEALNRGAMQFLLMSPDTLCIHQKYDDLLWISHVSMLELIC